METTCNSCQRQVLHQFSNWIASVALTFQSDLFIWSFRIHLWLVDYYCVDYNLTTSTFLLLLLINHLQLNGIDWFLLILILLFFCCIIISFYSVVTWVAKTPVCAFIVEDVTLCPHNHAEKTIHLDAVVVDVVFFYCHLFMFNCHSTVYLILFFFGGGANITLISSANGIDAFCTRNRIQCNSSMSNGECQMDFWLGRQCVHLVIHLTTPVILIKESIRSAIVLCPPAALYKWILNASAALLTLPHYPQRRKKKPDRISN